MKTFEDFIKDGNMMRTPEVRMLDYLSEELSNLSKAISDIQEVIRDSHGPQEPGTEPHSCKVCTLDNNL